MKEVESLKEEKRNAEQSYRNSMPSSLLQQQRLRVCEICSSYLGKNANLYVMPKNLSFNRTIILSTAHLFVIQSKRKFRWFT